jgi:tetratricopeptide (TPR) repeat protein
MPPPPPRRGPPRPGHLPGVHTRPAAPAGTSVSAVSRRFKSAWEELAFTYETLPAPDAAARLRNLYRAAEVWERGPADMARAFETLARALDIAPGDPEPKARMFRIAEEHDGWDRLAELYDNAADRAESVHDACALYSEIAEVRVRQKKPQQAEAVYRRILGMKPDDDRTRERLEALYRDEGRWVDLAASLEERTDPRLGSASDEAQRPAHLRELAVLYDEKLSKPYEAINTLERLRTLVSDDLESMEQIADLYAKVGRWAKVVEAQTRVADLAEGTPRAREARRRVAEIYEQELELPDRAIDAYQTVVAAWPDDEQAYHALDALLLGHARWHDLADVLKKRASLSQDPQARAEFLRRRAKVLLEWLDSPEEAVASLRHARTITPDDPSLADDMVEALTRSGRAREATAVLEARIAQVEQTGGAPGDVAALLLRLAQIRAEVLEDGQGARRALEKVLARVPDHPSALAALARLARAGADPREYADALQREASASVDVGAKVRALLEAGAVLRDRLEDVEGARAAFQEVVSLEPANAEAIWALSALVATSGDLETAAQLLESRLNEELPEEE